jgi:metal-responsive CopG/Arc/MetJ family transcriptional regulator
MARINVFLKSQLLDEINEEAKREGTNRSALIQTALEKYIEAKRSEREEEEKRKKMQEACRKMDALAKKLGKGDPQATIRKFRDTNLKGDS